MNTAIRVDHLEFAYPDKSVLNGVSLSIEKGEMIGILGPNGSGKTTFLRILSGVLAAKGGIQINRKAIRSYSRRELSRLCAVVPQENSPSFPYTVAEIVLMGRASHHHPLALEGERDLERARNSMELTETVSLASRHLHELSGGEKQRVMIARALAQDPQILLLDEPSAFLDLKHQIRALQLVRKLNREKGLTVIAALHDLNLAALFFPRLVILRNGKIFRDGSPKDVLTESAIEQAYGIRVKVQADTSGESDTLTIRPTLT
jgi:iron complex transport system ATP-binding protein